MALTAILTVGDPFVRQAKQSIAKDEDEQSLNDVLKMFAA